MNKKVNTQKYSIDIKRFAIFLLILLITIFLVTKLFSRKKIDENTNLSQLNSKKYSEEILQQYEKDGMKQKFIEEYENIQTKVAMYILNNSTMESDSFLKISTVLNKEFKENNWKCLGISKPKDWNGNWYINGNGILKFKFNQKEIEPSWVKDTELDGKIELN